MRQLELFPAMPSGRCPLCRSRAPRLDVCAKCVLRRAAAFAARPYLDERAADHAARRALIAQAAERARAEQERRARIDRLRALGRPVRVALVGCGRKKREGRHPARDLYTGPLFRAALAHAERTADETVILSALHGLIDPADEIAAYDVRLESYRKREREWWAARVVSALALRYPGLAVELTIYAGATYADAVELGLRFRPAWCRFELRDVRRPLGRLPVGKRLAWFKRERAATTPPDDGRRCASPFCWTILPADHTGDRCARCTAKAERAVQAERRRAAWYAREAEKEERRDQRAAERAKREADKQARKEKRSAERAARARARAEEKARKRDARRRREAEREERRRLDHQRNRGFVQEIAARELARNGGRMAVHCGGWVAYRGRVFEGRTFDQAQADAAIAAAAERTRFDQASPPGSW
jgi:hypothetical protein